MTPMLRIIIFLAIVLCVLALMHYYLWLRLVRDLMAPGRLRFWATVVIVLLAAGLPVGLSIRRFFEPASVRALTIPLYFWFGLAFLLVTLFALADIARFTTGLFVKAAAPDVTTDLGRRLLFTRGLTGVVGVFGLALGGVGAYRAIHRIRLRRFEVTLSRLSPDMDGTRVVQITDLHLGPTLDGRWLAGVVERVNRLRPDLIAITGDLVDGSVRELRSDVAPLGALSARYGAFFVTGNHEYYAGAVEWIAEIERLGIRVLRNERVPIGPDAVAFDLAGIDDHSAASHTPGHGPDLDKALTGRDPRRELLLLAHQPRAADEARRLGVGLQLSGHTHGGQIWPWHYAVYFQQPYLKGLHRHGDTQVYVSEGTGFWGPPMRVGSLGEITEVTLRAKGIA